jgi:mRNA interferase HigB
MRIIARRTLREFWENPTHQDAEQPLKAWYAEARNATWRTPAEVKAQYGSASVIGGNRVVFNIAGNKYRLVVRFHYHAGIGYVRFVGTHAEYDEIDAEVI